MDTFIQDGLGKQGFSQLPRVGDCRQILGLMALINLLEANEVAGFY